MVVWSKERRVLQDVRKQADQKKGKKEQTLLEGQNNIRE